MERFTMAVYVPPREHFASERAVIPQPDANGEWVRISDVKKLLLQISALSEHIIHTIDGVS